MVDAFLVEKYLTDLMVFTIEGMNKLCCSMGSWIGKQPIFDEHGVDHILAAERLSEFVRSRVKQSRRRGWTASLFFFTDMSVLLTT